MKTKKMKKMKTLVRQKIFPGKYIHKNSGNFQNVQEGSKIAVDFPELQTPWHKDSGMGGTVREPEHTNIAYQRSIMHR